MFCLWFAIHQEEVEIAQYVFTLDPVAKLVLKKLREEGGPTLAAKREDDKKKKSRKSKKLG